MDEWLAPANDEKWVPLTHNWPHRRPYNWSTELYQAVRQILASPNVYSNNLDCVQALSMTMNRVARINRLPDSNSLQAMETLVMAWDTVDICSREASRHKAYAKLFYRLMLLLGLAV